MAGHSHAANVAHRKNAQNKIKSKIFTKLQKLITIAVKNGSPEPELNPKLKNAIMEAREANMPKDKIESAIKKASNVDEKDNYEELRYNGYANGGVAIIIEALTNNKNRTSGDIRAILTKYGGNLGETGSVEYMFKRIGLLEYNKSQISLNEDELLALVIENNANNLEITEDLIFIETNFDNSHAIMNKLKQAIGEPKNARIIWSVETDVLINEEQKINLQKILDALYDLDDVQEVYHNGNL